MSIRSYLVLCVMVLIFPMVSVFAAMNFVPSIVPPHQEGFFVEFTALGYSAGFLEISTQPLLDLLGAFNLRVRIFPTILSVLNFEGYVFDPFFVPKVYGGLPADGEILLILGRCYWHGNIPVGVVVLRTHSELLGIGAYTKFQEVSSHAIPLFARGFVSLGFPLARNFELFANVEGGAFLDVVSSTIRDEAWDEMIKEAREKSSYLALRGGITWYYDNYSGLELGYRYILTGAESPVRFMQGYTITDWIYNVYNFFIASSGSEAWSIPFITTNYYISFSTKF